MDKEQIAELAQLSRLQLSDELVEGLAGDLEAILGYVEKLQSADIFGVEPLTHPSPMPQRRRKDQIAEVVGPRGLSGSAGFEADMVRVPKVVE